MLDDHHGPKDAFMVGGEFAHFHPEPDCSLHLTLPPGAASEVLSGGWGEPHYLAARGQIPGSHLMVYAPRDPVELEVVWKVLQVSYNFARGSWKPPSP
ncbi:MAG TPA: hypothetical protein VG452_08545 [Egibacteraceae bacterium]|nr:hypothetical protein [Egibacteraceae bacterium]